MARLERAALTVSGRSKVLMMIVKTITASPALCRWMARKLSVRSRSSVYALQPGGDGNEISGWSKPPTRLKESSTKPPDRYQRNVGIIRQPGRRWPHGKLRPGCGTNHGCHTVGV